MGLAAGLRPNSLGELQRFRRFPSCKRGRVLLLRGIDRRGGEGRGKWEGRGEKEGERKGEGKGCPLFI